MSAFFYLNILYIDCLQLNKDILILDKVSMKNERREGEGAVNLHPIPQKKLPPESPALLSLISIHSETLILS